MHTSQNTMYCGGEPEPKPLQVLINILAAIYISTTNAMYIPLPVYCLLTVSTRTSVQRCQIL